MAKPVAATKTMVTEAYRPAINLDPAQSGPESFNLDQLYLLGATKFGTKPILGLDGVKNHIDSGTIQAGASDGIITYTFAVSNHITGTYNNKHDPGHDAAYGYSRFTPLQEAAARTSIQLWDDLVQQTFVEQKGLGNADITLANSLDPGQAYAYYPYTDKNGLTHAGDLFTNDPNVDNWTNNWFSYLGYGNTTLIHELGHTLGLSHPGSYNYVPGVVQNYANLAEYAQDSTQYSIMSYWSASETGARIINWNALLYSYAQTPLVHDVLVIQDKYGADPTTRLGDTTYGFNSNAGNNLFDFSKNPYPYLTIYDAGGAHDKIDLSGFTTSQFIDLHAGSFSSIGGGLPDAVTAQAYLNNLTAISGEDWGTYDPVYTQALMTSFQNANATSISKDQAYLGRTAVSGIATTEYQNVSIAYGVTIEDATGGSGRDLIHGNEVANILDGGAGNDVLRGFEGNDTLLGGLGNDELFGDAGNDLLIGGGGTDRLTGGAGADTFKFTGLEIGEVITDFNQAQGDVIDLSGLGIDNLHFIDGAFTGQAGEVNYVNGVLSADADGNGAADFSVTLTTMPTLHPDALVFHA